MKVALKEMPGRCIRSELVGRRYTCCLYLANVHRVWPQLLSTSVKCLLDHILVRLLILPRMFPFHRTYLCPSLLFIGGIERVNNI